MSKPMLVTLPLVLLLLDYWPLRRFGGLEEPGVVRETGVRGAPKATAPKAARQRAGRSRRRPRGRTTLPRRFPQYAVLRLLLEKLPLLALSVAFSIVTCRCNAAPCRR